MERHKDSHGEGGVRPRGFPIIHRVGETNNDPNDGKIQKLDLKFYRDPLIFRVFATKQALLIVGITLVLVVGWWGPTRAARLKYDPATGRIIDLQKQQTEAMQWYFGTHPLLHQTARPLIARHRAQLKAASTRTIALASGIFDPLTGVTGFIRDARFLEPPPNNPYYIVQFAGAITPTMRLQLEGRGAEILEYIPHNAYLVRFKKAPARLMTLPGVRWVGPWLPAFKFGDVAWALLQIDRADPVFLEATLFRGVDPDLFLQSLPPSLRESQDRILRYRLKGSRVRFRVANRDRIPVLLRLIQMRDVQSVTRWYPPQIHNHFSRWTHQGGDPPNRYTPIHDRGLMGQGIGIAVMDTGLDTGMQFFRTNAAEAATRSSDPINWDKKVVRYINYAVAYDHDVCNEHGTHVTGSAAGDDYDHPNGGFDLADGAAPRAKILMQDIARNLFGLSCYLSGIGNLVNQIGTDAYQSGTDSAGQTWEVRIHTNSWGASTNGAYDGDSSDIDQVMWNREDMVVFFSAGNNGATAKNDSTIGSPATAKNDISVAALHSGAQHSEDLWWFSSRGPDVDNRLDPVLACNGDTLSAAGDQSINNGGDAYKWLSGTSMAAPTCAGYTGLIQQYFKEGWYPCGQKGCTGAQYTAPLNHLVKAVALVGAEAPRGIDEATGTFFSVDDPVPNNQVGFGRLNLERSLYFDGDTLTLKVFSVANGDAQALQTGQTYTATLDVTDRHPLRIVLAWTDPWAANNCNPCLVNNLDLKVTDPNGVVYRGNQWSGADSTGLYKTSLAGATATDTVNNVESVYVENPTPGTWTIQVIGASVPGNGTAGTNKQGFSIAAIGHLHDGGTLGADLLTSNVAVVDACDGDGIIDNGETVTLRLTVHNYGLADATNATVTLSVEPDSDVPASQITITPATVDLGTLAAGADAIAKFSLAHTQQATPPQGVIRLRATYSTGESEILWFHFNRDPDVTLTEDFESGPPATWTFQRAGGSSPAPFVCTGDAGGGGLGRSTTSELKFGGNSCTANYARNDDLRAWTEKTGPAFNLPSGAFLKNVKFFDKYQTYTNANASTIDLYRLYMDHDSNNGITIGNGQNEVDSDMILGYRIGPRTAVRDWAETTFDLRWTNDPRFPFGGFATLDPSYLFQVWDPDGDNQVRLGALIDDVRVTYSPLDTTVNGCSVHPGKIGVLRVTKSGGNLVLDWGGTPCAGTDYAVYQGTIQRPWMYNHTRIACTTQGKTTYTMTMPSGGAVYFLVTAETAGTEGSYGLRVNADTTSSERPAASNACKPQDTTSC